MMDFCHSKESSSQHKVRAEAGVYAAVFRDLSNRFEALGANLFKPPVKYDEFFNPVKRRYFTVIFPEVRLFWGLCCSPVENSGLELPLHPCLCCSLPFLFPSLATRKASFQGA